MSSGSEPPELGYVDIGKLANSVSVYDLSDMDAAWLELTKEEFKEMGMPELVSTPWRGYWRSLNSTARTT
jgi:protein Jade-1